MENVRVLKVKHYGETEAENRMITLSPMNVLALAAPEMDEIVQGRTVKRVAAIMADGGTMELVISDLDLNMMEEAVGCYALPY